MFHTSNLCVYGVRESKKLQYIMAVALEKEEEIGPFETPWKNSDAVFIVEDKELHVHSTILSLASPVFDKMLNGDFKEAQTKQVRLEGKSYPMVEHMLKMVYPNLEQKLGRCEKSIKL